MGKRGLGRAGGRAARQRTRSRAYCLSSASGPRAVRLHLHTVQRVRVLSGGRGQARARAVGRARGGRRGGARDRVLLFERERLAGAASASRPSLASVARRAPGGAASGHGRAGLAEQWSGPAYHRHVPCSASSSAWTPRRHGRPRVKRAADLEFGWISGTAGRTGRH